MSVIWSVEVELQEWRGWHPLAARRLRRGVESDAEVLHANGRGLEHLLLRSTPATIVVDVEADSPGAAAAKAERAVKRALTELRKPSGVRAWIISTDGESAPFDV